MKKFLTIEILAELMDYDHPVFGFEEVKVTADQMRQTQEFDFSDDGDV